MKKLTTAKKLLLLLLVLCIAVSPLGTAAVAASFSDVPASHWASEFVEKAAGVNLVKGTGDGRFAPDATVSYAEWCTMLCNLFYADEVETYLSLIGPGLNAWYLPNVIVCYQQEALSGTAYLRHAAGGAGWESEISIAPTSRYDMAQTIFNVSQEMGWTTLHNMTDEKFELVKSVIGDWNSIPSEYQVAVSYCYMIGFLRGVDSQNRFAGSDTLTRGAAAAVLCRLYDASNGVFPSEIAISPAPTPTPTPMPTPTPTPEPTRAPEPNSASVPKYAPMPLDMIPYRTQAHNPLSVDGQTSRISWPALPGVADYELTIIEDRESIREDIGPHAPVTLRTGGAASYIYPFNPRRLYTITCTPLDSAGQPVGTPMETTCYFLSIYGSVTEYLNEPIADKDSPLLETITVNVWKLNANGSKSPSTMSLTVHSKLASEFAAVFQEIFEGEEQFPIHSLGGWRVSTGAHGCGTAVDINANENYCLYTDGRVVGSHWKPYEDPYSITPYGDVVRSFERHGFVWGGDAWYGNIDYMHFSYYGN